MVPTPQPFKEQAMKLSLVFGISAIIAVAFGLAFVFAPVQTIATYGPEVNTPAWRYVAQLFGAAMVGYGVMNWLARNTVDSEARHALVVGNLVAMVLGFALSLIAQLQGVVNALGWSSVLIYGVLALGFARYAFARRSGAAHAF
jgi:uncharacterized protein involved in cysteine biosynthesis